MAKTYLIETFGCQMNFHDSERMAGLLEQAGYEPAENMTTADVVVVNTCSVRERAEEKLFSRLGEIRQATAAAAGNPVVAVTGCVAQQEGERLVDRNPSVSVVVGTQALRRLPTLVEAAAASRADRPLIDINPYDDVSFPLGLARRGDPVKAYVTIVEGCNDFCSFCVVPYTRGHERMRAAGEIIGEVREAVESGRREVHLLGQIVNDYRAPDIPHCDFAGLLERVQQVPGVARIRFASPHPRHVSPRLIGAMRDLPSVCKHLHLPLQSGSSRILEAMRRRYTREQYLRLVDDIRAAVPDITLSTDIIVGFPGESTADFEETMSLIDAVRFHGMFSFKYSKRPGTLAAKRMPETVDDGEKTRRIVALQQRQQSIQRELNEGLVGTTMSVLVDARSRRNDQELSGRATGNTVVNFPGRPDWLGRFVSVTVRRAGPNSVWGEPGSVPLTPPAGSA